MKFVFTVPGEPRGKGRPRFVRAGNYVRAYTPDATAAYENLIRVSYQASNGPFFDQDKQLSIHLVINMKIPESTSKSRKASMIAGNIRPTKKPDADNVLKAVLDGLNTVAWHDDAQIVEVAIERWYSERPGLKIMIADEDSSTMEE